MINKSALRRFHKLCAEGNLHDVKEFITKNVTYCGYETVDFDPYAAIHHAVANKQHGILSFLLNEVFTDPDLYAGFESPLHIATRAKDETSITLLLQNGANPNVVDRDGLTPMCVAFDQNSPNLAKLIVDTTRIPIDLDRPVNNQGVSMRTLMRQEYPNVELPEPMIDRGIDAYILLYSLVKGEFSKFINDFETQEKENDRERALTIHEVELLITSAAAMNDLASVAAILKVYEFKNLKFAIRNAIDLANLDILSLLIDNVSRNCDSVVEKH